MTSKNELPHIIESLNELVDSLTEGERVTYSHIMKAIQLPKLICQEISSWSQDCYTRNCIAQNDQFELILICWEKDQITPIHDHGGEECWVKVLDGKFRETLYEKNNTGELIVTRTMNAEKGDITYMVDFMGYHRLENMSDERSMTLHLYAKPIKNCNIFDEETETFVPKDMSYDTVLEITSQQR